MRDDEGKARRFAKHLRQSMTDAELILWSRLRRWPSGTIKFRRQHPIGIYIADFAVVAARLVIEVDGATHSSDSERTYDEVRDTYLRRRGWRVLRVRNDDVYKRLNDVLDFIASQLPPPFRYRGTPHP